MTLTPPGGFQQIIWPNPPPHGSSIRLYRENAAMLTLSQSVLWRVGAFVLTGILVSSPLRLDSRRAVCTAPTPMPVGELPAPDLVARMLALSLPVVAGLECSGEELTAREGVVRRLRTIFSEEGVPPRLVWIAEVESQWNPHAVSHAGAVGLFQFMPETAQRFGLRGEGYDARHRPYPSGRAAARYLRVLYDQFGSWPLAVAAYNAGEGRVDKAVRFTGKTQFEDIEIFLPRETRHYVRRVMSTVDHREALHLAESS